MHYMQALTWAFNAMIEHPEAEAQLLQELQQQQLPPQPSYSEVKALRLAHATFLEVLRLWPSVPADMKFCVRDDVLPDGTQIPAGAGVVWAPYVMGRLESIWGPDALDFRWVVACVEAAGCDKTAGGLQLGGGMCGGRCEGSTDVEHSALYLHGCEGVGAS